MLFFALLATLLALLTASPARAAVTYVGHACANTSTGWPVSLSVGKPAGTQANDILIATLRAKGDAVLGNSAPTGWVKLLATGGDAVSWYKVATASEPANYSFSFTSFDTTRMAGSVTAFRGASAARPFADQQQTSSGTSATISLPNATVSDEGSMRYSAIMSGDDVSATFSAGLTELCDEANGGVFVSGVGVASAYEPVAVGTTPTRSVTRSASGSHTSQTYVLRPPGACEAGGLSLTPPGAVTFGTVALDGKDRTVSTTAALTVDDASGSGAGWRLSLAASQFTSTNGNLPADAVQITATSASAQPGSCSPPSNSATAFPMTLGSTPAVIANAAAGSGAGPTLLSLDTQLQIPARARAGGYSSTWTLTLAAGP